MQHRGKPFQGSDRKKHSQDITIVSYGADTGLNLPKICVGRDILSNINNALTREWIVTNGLGGYASSTVLGTNTRKYHGLLIAALNPPVNRWVLLAKLDEEIKFENKTCMLGTNEFKDTVYPQGYNFLCEFILDPLPTFRYSVNDVAVQKTVFMPYMKNAPALIYDVFNGSDEKISFNVSPLVNSRHIYDTTNKESVPWKFNQGVYLDGVVVTPSDSLSALILSAGNTGSYVKESWWVNNAFFRVDASRNENSIDDYFRPGYFEFPLYTKEEKRFFVLATGGKTVEDTERLFISFGRTIKDIEQLQTEELNRRKGLLEQFKKQNTGIELEDWLKWLVQDADSFIISRASTGKKSVIAGYNWFDDWGRDSLISLAGLTLVSGRFDDAKQILLTFEQNCSNGIIPNRFSDKAGDIPLYNTVDATLWFFNAVFQYLKYTGDFGFVKEHLWKTLMEIVDHHVKGTIFGIHMDEDGLIAHGPQLTWMDAVTTEQFVTPRSGKAVEIQALWYNALRVMELLAKQFNQPEDSEKYYKMARTAKISFLKLFWDEKVGYLYDVISKGDMDGSLRPNQLIAVSLDFPIVDMGRAKKLMDIVYQRLWGKYGLKTLPDDDPRYNGKYFGNWTQRDTAYHNGTIWPWLIGPFTTAFLKTKGYAEPWRNFAFKNFLNPLFRDQLTQAALGTISEIFDGDEPHRPRGCISQAWSISEPLRAYVEDVAYKRPAHEKEVMHILE
jgi:predicted glycogen debranching enzyme